MNRIWDIFVNNTVTYFTIIQNKKSNEKNFVTNKLWIFSRGSAIKNKQLMNVEAVKILEIIKKETTTLYKIMLNKKAGIVQVV